MPYEFATPEEFIRWAVTHCEIPKLDELDPVLTDIQRAERRAKLRDERLFVLVLREKEESALIP